jgi:hypothetical protein
MTIFKQPYIRIDPRVYPHAGTAVEPPDAQVPGVSPAGEGLGMEEPSAADRAVPLSNLVKTAPPPVLDLPPLFDHTPHKVIDHLPPQDARQERGGQAEPAAPSANIRLSLGAIAARAQGLSEDRRGARVWGAFRALSVVAEVGARGGQRP